ncbi:flagellar hook-associated protein FlgK [Sporanaerobacter acetigenes]|uniref:Flagellar hook-associated protein 1 n=1 Tax=Sporanaerobacter acetigenes DSM 13106 TaxID=1123281 RepID=A0A1M5STF9_9FIRM|nr:flagellar hook-associated protein FlgK [Sporanaerobacter acetigenes]SHH41829.1 flagellar hook-associated protein 1 FlgK [Sporanaerobacter acetigenes DSM 13106]
MYGFNTAVSGLLASQRALYVTNHNISNMNTDGYSRQVALQRATNPMSLPGIGYLGTGTEIYDIVRMRDSYVDFKYWNESAPKGEWEAKRTSLLEIEKLLGEPSDSSFRKYMDDFFSSLDELSKNPSDYAFRQPVKESALSLTKHINETAKRLENMRKETIFSIDTKVKQINDIADQIGNLNKQIYVLELDGKSANDLRDKRELLVDELSKIVNVRVDESKDGKYRVNVGGISLIDHDYINKMEYKPKNSAYPYENRELKWADGNKVTLQSGELKGLIELVEGDGEKGSYRGIPFYQKKLDDFAGGFAGKINEQHGKGYDLEGEQGKEFFTFDANNPALTISVSQAILEDVGKIAAAGTKDGVEDNTNILKIIDLREDKAFFGDGMSKGTPDDFIKSILSNLAVDSMQAQRMDSTQKLIIKNIEKRRQSESGVYQDEEMTNLVKFQHSYTASARMITTLDQILDVTINRLGLVGR